MNHIGAVMPMPKQERLKPTLIDTERMGAYLRQKHPGCKVELGANGIWMITGSRDILSESDDDSEVEL